MPSCLPDGKEAKIEMGLIEVEPKYSVDRWVGCGNKMIEIRNLKILLKGGFFNSKQADVKAVKKLI